MKSSDKTIIGITGGIGSGKSVVSRILRLNGFPVYDCDLEAKRLMTCNDGLRQSLLEILGEGVYLPDGSLDRRFVSERIFADAQLLKRVNGAVHAKVKEDFLDYADREKSEMVFCESAILSTSGFDTFCDGIWLVTAPDDVRCRRVMSRNGMREEEVLARMQAQEGEWSGIPESKLKVIRNDGESLLLPQVLSICKDKEISEYEITINIINDNQK